MLIDAFVYLFMYLFCTFYTSLPICMCYIFALGACDLILLLFMLVKHFVTFFRKVFYKLYTNDNDYYFHYYSLLL